MMRPRKWKLCLSLVGKVKGVKTVFYTVDEGRETVKEDRTFFEDHFQFQQYLECGCSSVRRINDEFKFFIRKLFVQSSGWLCHA